jgi:elongation factor P
MLSYTDLKKGTIFVMENEPYEVLEYGFLRMQQRKPTVQLKIKNLITNKIIQKSIHQNESFKEAEIDKKQAVFIYSHRGEFWFYEQGNPKARFSLPEKSIEETAKFLKKDMLVNIYKFNDKIIKIEIPIKMDFKVVEAPPGIKGNTAQGGTKLVVLENGLEISVPLFIEEGDIVRINTETRQYVERVIKTKSKSFSS